MHWQRRERADSSRWKQGFGSITDLSWAEISIKEGKGRKVFVCFEAGITYFASTGWKDSFQIWYRDWHFRRTSPHVPPQFCQSSGRKWRRSSIGPGDAGS